MNTRKVTNRWEEAVMTYQNYLNYHALKEFGESKRAELLKEAENERLRPETALSRNFPDHAYLLLRPAQALAALIFGIFQR